MDLYAILGLDNKATKGDIKKAYRTLSKTCHPDQGGDSAEFVQLNLAYKVLSDDESRRLYDDHGVVLDEGPGHLDRLVQQRVQEVLNVWLDRVQKGEPRSLRKHVDAVFASVTDQIETHNAEITDVISNLEKIRQRVTCEGENLVHNMVDARILTYQKGYTQNKKEKILLENLRDKLSTYEDDFEEEFIARGFPMGNGATIIFRNGP